VSTAPPRFFLLHEGRNREIRRLFAAAGLRVRRLVRVAIGPIALGELPPAVGRELSADEVAALAAAVAAQHRAAHRRGTVAAHAPP
jgi:23S rRNA pseudouridine2605 synthase